jgi:hypothetical protein
MVANPRYNEGIVHSLMIFSIKMILGFKGEC